MPLDTQKMEARRLELGLSQEEAATGAGLHGRQVWNDIVSGRKTNVTINTLESIARSLSLNPKDLLH